MIFRENTVVGWLWNANRKYKVLGKLANTSRNVKNQEFILIQDLADGQIWEVLIEDLHIL